MAGERKQGFDSIETSKMRLTNDGPWWIATSKDPACKDQRLQIDKFRGTLSFYPSEAIVDRDRRLTWADRITEDLYKETVALLTERGIDIPGPNPKYQELDQLLASLRVSYATEIDPEKSPFCAGQPLIFTTVRDPRLSEERRTSKVLYIGKTTPDYKAGAGGYIQNKAQRIDFEDIWRIEYDHFAPAEQHITGVFQWRPRLFMAKGDYSWSKWTPMPRALSENSFEVIKATVEKVASPFENHILGMQRR